VLPLAEPGAAEGGASFLQPVGAGQEAEEV